MKIRRCNALWLEPRDVARFELADLLAGGTGVVGGVRWFAHAPHLPGPVEVAAGEVPLLGSLSPCDWVESDPLRARLDEGRLEAWLDAGLLVGDDAARAGWREADECFRGQHWFALSAISHAAARWSGTDAAGCLEEAGLVTSADLRARHGVPPPALPAPPPEARMHGLPRPSRTPLDELFDRRSTCRNFDASRTLALDAFAHVLERTFGVRGKAHAADDFDVLKKTSPSGGSLHPTEAYLIVRKVEGVAPGLYHYHAGEHALRPLPFDMDTLPPGAEKHPHAAGKPALDYLAWIAVGGQQWFADAHALVVLAPRFARNYWKYRNHAKAYRVCILDVGHLSQTLLLTATELGLGAYVTAAINEADIERAFGLVHYVDGPLAVCGFGPRADTMLTAEFDPNRKAWPPRNPQAGA